MALYGLSPTPDFPNPMHPVIRLKAPVLQVRAIDRDGTVGYGATATVRMGQWLATLAIG